MVSFLVITETAFPGSKRFSPLYHPDKYDNDGDHQKDVNESAQGERGDQSEKPQQYQNHRNSE
jgi:hypothetical protein